MNGKPQKKLREVPFHQMLETLDTVLNSTHVLLDFVIRKYKSGGNLDKELPALERHLRMLSHFAGSTDEIDAAKLLKKIGSAPGFLDVQ